MEMIKPVISHITLGTNDLDRAVAFYTPIMEALKLRRVPMERSAPFAMWNRAESFRPAIALALPENGQPHHPGNGHMLALLAPDRPTVSLVHHLAMDGGGSDEGAPGPREEGSDICYAYIRDPDGSKICAFYDGVKVQAADE